MVGSLGRAVPPARWWRPREGGIGKRDPAAVRRRGGLNTQVQGKRSRRAQRILRLMDSAIESRMRSEGESKMGSEGESKISRRVRRNQLLTAMLIAGLTCTQTTQTPTERKGETKLEKQDKKQGQETRFKICPDTPLFHSG